MLKNKTIFLMSILASAITLSACQPQQAQDKQELSQNQEEEQPLKLEGDLEKLSLNLPKCQDNNCPGLSIDRLNSNQPYIDAVIDQQILQILKQTLMDESIEASAGVPEKPKQVENQEGIETAKQKLEKQVVPFTQAFLELDEEVKALSANHKISLMIKPKILNSEGPLVTVVLNSSNYLGGAHGSASQQYFNFDLEKKKMIPLKELVEKNKLSMLESKAHEAFKTWVIDSELAEDVDEYEQIWKFKLSDNYYLGNQGLILQYGEYEIGPYVVGLPRLTIPYEQLQGILQPKYLPEGLVENQQQISKTTQVKH